MFLFYKFCSWNSQKPTWLLFVIHFLGWLKLTNSIFKLIIYILRRQTVHAFFGIPKKVQVASPWEFPFWQLLVKCWDQKVINKNDVEWAHVDCIPVYSPWNKQRVYTWKWDGLEYDCFLLRWPIFRGELLVSGSVPPLKLERLDARYPYKNRQTRINGLCFAFLFLGPSSSGNPFLQHVSLWVNK